jgi:hypothetical protein
MSNNNSSFFSGIFGNLEQPVLKGSTNCGIFGNLEQPVLKRSSANEVYDSMSDFGSYNLSSSTGFGGYDSSSNKFDSNISSILELKIITGLFMNDIKNIKTSVNKFNINSNLGEIKLSPLSLAITISNNDEIVRFLLSLNPIVDIKILKNAKSEYLDLLINYIKKSDIDEIKKLNSQIIDYKIKNSSIDSKNHFLQQTIQNYEQKEKENSKIISEFINDIRIKNKELYVLKEDTIKLKEDNTKLKRKCDEIQNAFNVLLEKDKKKPKK